MHTCRTLLATCWAELSAWHAADTSTRATVVGRTQSKRLKKYIFIILPNQFPNEEKYHLKYILQVRTTCDEVTCRSLNNLPWSNDLEHIITQSVRPSHRGEWYVYEHSHVYLQILLIHIYI